MKTKVMTLLIVALGCFAIGAQAQTESGIKVLPTNTPGMIKVLHASSVDKSVNVAFINDDGKISNDRITGSFPKGVMKRYDVSSIPNKDFLVEVSSNDVTVTYRVTASKDRKRHTPTLEKVEYHNQPVASR